MNQPLKRQNKNAKQASKPKKRGGFFKKWHPKFGTSKLEEDFARDFLDKLGVEYIYQYEAKDIGRFFDFMLEGRLLVEIDGDYYHSNPLLYEGKELNKMQLRNKKVDELKNRWALLHGIPILRIWEHDIRNNPKMVMDMLIERLNLIDKEKEKKKRH